VREPSSRRPHTANCLEIWNENLLSCRFCGLFGFALLGGVLGIFRVASFGVALFLAALLLGSGLVFGGLGLLFSLMHFNIVGVVFIGIRLAINALILGYLLQPNVRMAFEGRPRPMTATA